MVRTGQFVASASQRFWGAEVIITSVTFPACALRTDTPWSLSENRNGRGNRLFLRTQSDDTDRRS